jgi:hypothetical protein
MGDEKAGTLAKDIAKTKARMPRFFKTVVI